MNKLYCTHCNKYFVWFGPGAIIKSGHSTYTCAACYTEWFSNIVKEMEHR